MASSSKSIPWVELYRPKSLDQVSHQEEVVATLQNAVKTGQLPHLLLHGPPGSGKTSVALALCKQLFSPSQFKRRVLELNASDERGISVVRDKIKLFATLTVGTGSKKSSSKNFFSAKTNGDDYEMRDDYNDEENYPNPPFKVIILDESDAITPDAQAALRRIIEANSSITRFILICNYISRIIAPLASRCAKFRFQRLPVESMKERLESIAKTEGFTIEDNIMEEVLKLSKGDMRKAVTTLQCVSALGGNVTREAVYEMASLCPPPVVDALWKEIASCNFNRMQSAVEDVCADGYSAQILLSALSQKIVDSTELNDMGKAKVSIQIAEAEKMMVDGGDEFLSLMNVCSTALSSVAESKESTT